MEFRKDIQILRGLAVLFVVLYHLQVPFFKNGYLGVDIFFVISGFLMAKLYNRGSITDFYKRRINRLLPAYTATVIATLIVGCFVLIPTDFIQLFKQSVSSAVFSSNLYFWNQNSYFSSSEFNPLLNLWSLAVEVQFYLIVPFLYPILRRRAWLTLVVIILSFAACVAVQSVSPKTSFFLTPFRIWEFLMGAFVAWSFSYHNIKTIYGEFLRAGLIVTLIGFLCFVALDPNGRSIWSGHPSLAAFFVCLLTAGIIAVGLPRLFEENILGTALAKIGDYSYSIYLIHFPLIVMLNYQEFGGTILSFDSQAMLAIAIICTALLSYLSYHYIEDKGRAVFNSNKKYIALLISIFIVCLATYAINLKGFSDRENNIFSAFTDRSPYRCGKIFRILNPLSDICSIGEKSHEDAILLVGDSHADSIKTVLAKAANTNKKRVFFYVDNEPLVNKEILSDKIIQDAQSLKVQAILLHFSNKYKKSGFAQEVLHIAKKADELGLKVVIIAPVPTYSSSVPKTMYYKKDQESGGTFVIDRKMHKEKISDFTALSKTLERHGVSIIDPASIFCLKQEACFYADQQGKPFYFDASHLTLTGSGLLQDLFFQKIKEIF